MKQWGRLLGRVILFFGITLGIMTMTGFGLGQLFIWKIFASFLCETGETVTLLDDRHVCMNADFIVNNNITAEVMLAGLLTIIISVIIGLALMLKFSTLNHASVTDDKHIG